MTDQIATEVREGRVFALLPPESQRHFRELPSADLRRQVDQILSRPQTGYLRPAERFLMNACLAAQWLLLFEQLQFPRDLKLYEPCVGSSDPVILAAEIYTEGQGEYTAVNLNRKLAQELREKIGGLRMKITLIEDAAQRASIHLRPQSLDAACFHHAINDLLQTAVAARRGMDTRDIDWWDTERQMIEWLAEDVQSGVVEQDARQAVLDAVREARRLVRPGGCLLFDHWTFDVHRELSWFPWVLFNNLLPLARGWIRQAEPDLQEEPLPGHDPQWWMLLRVP